MNESGAVNLENVFAISGLLSALVTLALGAFWLSVLVMGAGLIFSIALFTMDSLLQRRRPASARTPFLRRVIAAVIVAFSYPCGVIIFISLSTFLDSLGVGPRALVFACGMSAASLITAFGFYWAIKMSANTTTTTLAQLLLIALCTAVLSGSADAWGKKVLILRPHWFISPVWATLLLFGETGFAWVWGKASQSSPEPRVS